MPQQDSILKVNGLSVSYGTFTAVKDVSFDVRSGEIFGLLGPNGAGKTSTLSAIEGLVKFQTGSIEVDGYDAKVKPLYARAAMGVQLQSTSFQPELNVPEILKLYAGIYGVPLTNEKVDAILREIKLEDAVSKRFGQLSNSKGYRCSFPPFTTQGWCSWMNQPPASTRNRAGSYGNVLRPSAKKAMAFCLQPIQWKKPNLFAIVSVSSIMGK